MRRFVFDKARVNEWLYHRVGRERPFEPERSFAAVGVEEDGELIAGVIVDSFVKEARCALHCAGIGKRWCTRKLLQLVFDYVFNVAKCKVVVNTVGSDNLDSIRFTEHVGFEEAARIPDGDGDADLIIYTLHRERCRWIDRGNNEEPTRLAA